MEYDFGERRTALRQWSRNLTGWSITLRQWSKDLAEWSTTLRQRSSSVS